MYGWRPVRFGLTGGYHGRAGVAGLHEERVSRGNALARNFSRGQPLVSAPSERQYMRKVFMLLVLASLAVVGTAIGGSAVAGAAGSSASGASASGDQATAARRRGRRGRRGPRGRRGAAGPSGPQGPVGPAGGTGGGSPSSGGVVPIEFRGNAGTPLQLLFLYGGVQVEVDCAAAAGTRGARLRSTAENGVAMANFDVADADGPAGTVGRDNFATNRDEPNIVNVWQTSDGDFDNNDRIDLSGPGTPQTDGLFKGFFSFSGAAGTVVTGTYVTSIAYATAQGDCVFVGNLNRD